MANVDLGHGQDKLRGRAPVAPPEELKRTHTMLVATGIGSICIVVVAALFMSMLY